MPECTHPRLVRNEGVEHGGLGSNVFDCKVCGELLVVTMKPLEITVSEGRPVAPPPPAREPGSDG